MLFHIPVLRLRNMCVHCACKMGRRRLLQAWLALILVAFRHGLRASELVGLRWDQVSFSGAVLHVRRRKKRH